MQGHAIQSHNVGYYQCKAASLFLDLCVSSLREGHANLLCICPILTDVTGVSLCCQ